jgi:hypothetical protein
VRCKAVLQFITKRKINRTITSLSVALTIFNCTSSSTPVTFQGVGWTYPPHTCFSALGPTLIIFLLNHSTHFLLLSSGFGHPFKGLYSLFYLHRLSDSPLLSNYNVLMFNC